MAHCKFQDLSIQRVDDVPMTRPANFPLLPDYPTGGPFDTMQQCQSTLCESVGECIPAGFKKSPQMVNLPENTKSDMTLDECLDDCRLHKECVATIFDGKKNQCATFNQGQPKLAATHTSTATLYVRNQVQ